MEHEGGICPEQLYGPGEKAVEGSGEGRPLTGRLLIATLISQPRYPWIPALSQGGGGAPGIIKMQS